MCRIGNKEKWVPLSQIHDDSEVYEKGHKGKLVVTQWLADKWENEKDDKPSQKEEPPVTLHDVVCLRESAKAILIRQGSEDNDEIWIPRTQVLPDSEVLGDGDVGELKITAWIAKEKKLV